MRTLTNFMSKALEWDQTTENSDCGAAKDASRLKWGQTTENSDCGAAKDASRLKWLNVV